MGGGFAGVGAATKLAEAPVDVVLVDANDYHTFQPLLYQVATGLMETPAIAHPLRDLFHDQPNVHVRQATVSGIDRANRRVEFEDMDALSYDYLVIALGARVNFFGVDGADEHAIRCTPSRTRYASRNTFSGAGRRPTETRRSSRTAR